MGKSTFRPVAHKPRQVPRWVPLNRPSTTTASVVGATRLGSNLKSGKARWFPTGNHPPLGPVEQLAVSHDLVAGTTELADAAGEVVGILKPHVLVDDLHPPVALGHG